MIAWTITVPPTVGTAIATYSSNFAANDAQYAVEIIILENGETVPVVVASGGGITVNSFSGVSETLENANTVYRQTYIGNETNAVGVTILSWDGNVFVNDDAGLVA